MKGQVKLLLNPTVEKIINNIWLEEGMTLYIIHNFNFFIFSEQHTMLFGGSTQCRTKNEDGKGNLFHQKLWTYSMEETRGKQKQTCWKGAEN